MECFVEKPAVHVPPKHRNRPTGEQCSTKTAQERPEERDKELKMSTRPPKSPDPDPIKHLG